MLQEYFIAGIHGIRYVPRQGEHLASSRRTLSIFEKPLGISDNDRYTPS